MTCTWIDCTAASTVEVRQGRHRGRVLCEPHADHLMALPSVQHYGLVKVPIIPPRRNRWDTPSARRTK